MMTTLDARDALHHALEADWESLWIGHNSEALISSTASLTIQQHPRSLIFYRGLPPVSSDPTWNQLLSSTGFLQTINRDHDKNLPGLLRKPLGWGEVVVIEPGVDHPHQSGTRTTDPLWLDLLQREPLPIPIGYNPQLVLRDDRIIFTHDELIQADLLWNPQAKVALPTHLRLQSLNAAQSRLKPVTITSYEPELGIARVNLGPLPPDRYRIGIPDQPDSTENDLLIEVREFDPEWLDVRSQPQTLIALAQVTSGKVLTRHNLAELNITTLNQSLLPISAYHTKLIPVWDRWWVLALVFMLMAWGWWIRSREGVL
ncbi:MAG: hypothetical protein HC898_09580 [Phycisphaerales bacterium]|nr:hypothetical protein [Phycisphaerales bacterium]